MGANGSRQMTYEQYYEAIRNNPAQYANTDLNPYEVLGVRKNFEWEELKQAYRRVAKLVHPDKGGSEILFNKVTECFKQLASEYKARTADRPHHELRAESQNYYEQNQAKTPIDIRGVPTVNTDGSFIDRFNKAFDDNRLDDEEDGGYGHMMEKSNKKREDISIQPILKGKVTRDVFNKTFETVTLASIPSKDVVVYREPEALQLAKKLQFTELGGEKPGDYSSGVDIAANKQGLQYTDYMKAHTTTRLVDPRTVEKKKQFRSVQEYQTARETAMERPASEDELRYRAEMERKEKEREEIRVRRLQEKDQMISNHHARVNQLFLGASLSR